MYQPPQQPPQGQRPQQNTQYPPQWQPRPPYPQQPYQSPPVYYPPQHYYQQVPPVLPPPPPPKKKSPAWIVIATIVGLLLLCGLISNITHSQGATTNTTSDVQPTDTPTPTPLTDKAAINAQIKSDIANASLQGVAIIAGFGTNASVIESLPTPGMSPSDQLSFVQTDCFNAQKVVWQDPLLRNIKYLDFAVTTLDSQGLPSVVGECILDLEHASKIDWNNTDAVTAWNNKVYQDMTPSN
jgi:hypothetical protein